LYILTQKPSDISVFFQRLIIHASESVSIEGTPFNNLEVIVIQVLNGRFTNPGQKLIRCQISNPVSDVYLPLLIYSQGIIPQISDRIVERMILLFIKELIRRIKESVKTIIRIFN
jgi:hypothetical protein